jgi:hypothetical protein
MGRQAFLFGGSAAGELSRENRRSGKAKLKPVRARKAALFDPEPDVPVDPASPFLPGLEPPKDERTLMQRLLENGTTTLDRLHQAMILFGRGQTALLKPFLFETGMGQHERYWTLADCLSRLYPSKSDEKRWVDGVLGRKKGMGF